MRKSLQFAAIVAATLCFTNNSWAQVSQGGQPNNWPTLPDYDQIDVIRTPILDMDAIALEDAENDQYKEFAYRFGIEHAVSIDTDHNGTWTSDGKTDTWKLGINCPGAKAISVRFDEFDLPDKAKVFLYDAERTHFIGSFTKENQQANGSLATSLVYSENVVIELSVPTGTDPSEWSLTIDQIVHAYRGMNSKFEELKADRGPFGSSGACNININCPEGDDWQVEKNSVALIVSGGNSVCTGALVNNTNNDGHPYFLTADHCLGGVGNWVFYFNHESPGCGGNNGPTDQSVSGAIVVASNGGSDFGLLEINNGNQIPAGFGVEFAGWDNSDSEAAVSAATGIHHPGGDIMKICHETDAPYHANQGGAAVWYIDEWEEGVTEGGSSGSPLFNQEHRIIGQLYGGWAACAGQVNNGEPDWYGRFGVSWDGNNASSRLRDWLDPNDTGIEILDGFPTGSVQFALDGASNGIGGVEDGQTFCDSILDVTPVFTLRNAGEDTLTAATIDWSVDGAPQTPYNWTGSLPTYQSEAITFDMQTFGFGNHNISFTISNVNGNADMNAANDSADVNFTLVDGGQVTVSILTDDYAEETTWEIVDDSNGTVVASGGGYADATQYDVLECLADGCYTFTIYDDFGDGICCEYGIGDYEVVSPLGDIMGLGGEFDEEESVQFCLPFVVPPPVGNFNATEYTVCAPESVTFNSTSTPDIGVTHTWTFEGGNPAASSETNPTVTYSTAGVYDVTLVVSNSAGSDTVLAANQIEVHPAPSASATSTPEDVTSGGGNNGSVTVTASGGTPPYTYSWAPGGGSTETVDDLSGGNYTVTVTDSEGCTTTATATVGSNVSINDLELAEAIAVYPNPAKGQLWVEFPEGADVLNLAIMDLVGKKVLTQNTTGTKRIQIDISLLAGGVYHLSFYTAEKQATKKVVVIGR